jgi:hypothetical protein
MLNLKVGLLGVVLLGATIAVACSSTSYHFSMKLRLILA